MFCSVLFWGLFLGFGGFFVGLVFWFFFIKGLFWLVGWVFLVGFFECEVRL